MVWAQEPAQEPAQETSHNGNIAGTVTDLDGVPVPGAKVSIRGRVTQINVAVKTSMQGEYLSEDLPQGIYSVEIEARNFQTLEFKVGVQGGATSHGDAKLVRINPATTMGILTTPDIVDTLPANGRNAQGLGLLQPSVQVVDGAVLEDRKAGLLGLSLDQRSGKTTRISLDGLDLQDETTGGAKQNVPVAGLHETEVFRATGDISEPLAAAGVTHLTTRSGANAIHGSGFYAFRNNGAGNPGGLDLPFTRNQYGAAVGGAIVKDKAFYYAGFEATRQGGDNPVALTFPFNELSGGYRAPFRDVSALLRLDYKFSPTMEGFYRGTYDGNNGYWPISSYSPFRYDNAGRNHGGGLDFTRGPYTHSIRFGYSRFANNTMLPDLSGVPNPAPGLNVLVGPMQTGPSERAFQNFIENYFQGRYDGSRPWKKHSFHFGGAINRISSGGTMPLGLFAPTVTGSANLANVQSLLSAASPPFAPLVSGDPAGAADNPLNYAVNGITIYSGRGFTSEKSAFGYSGGGHADTRLDAYIGDSFQLFPNLSVKIGVQYVRDTGRTSSDVAPVLCSQVNKTIFPHFSCGIDSNYLLDQFGFIGGLGTQVSQPNFNFSPQLGVAWDPGRNGRTVVRGGIGMYFDNNLFNNTLLDRRVRQQQGSYFGSYGLCPNGTVLFPDGSRVSSVDGLDIATQICGQPIGTVATAVSDLQKQYQAAIVAAGPGVNPYFVGNTLSGSSSLIAPRYASPRVTQITAGMQRELRHGSILSVDYVRNIGTHYLLGSDTNHVGDSAYLSIPAALAAINATIAGNPLTSGICPRAIAVGSSSEASVNCYLAQVPNASITDFARNGLDSGNAYCGGYACAALGKLAAFPGINPTVGSNVMYFPVGRSSYNALQLSFRTSADNPFRGAKHLDLTFSYTYSRYKDNVPVQDGSSVANEDVLARAQDFNHTNFYFGPSSLDRTHQISFGPVFTLPHGLLFSTIGRFASPLPLTLYVPQAGGGGVAGEIFRSDTTGDGTVGDVLPGTHIGAYGRGITSSNLNQVITGYNRNFAGAITAAGQQLVIQQIMTSGQAVLLGAITPTLSSAPANLASPQWLKVFDVRLAWPYRLNERVTLEPRVSAYNILNVANFDSPGLQLSGIMDGAPGQSVGNSTSGCGIVTGICTARANRIGTGSGTYSEGSHRQLEFGVKVTF
jgi:hypothetical protein